MPSFKRLLALAVPLFIPLVAFAQTIGLVPCGNTSGNYVALGGISEETAKQNYLTATACNLCDLVTLVQNIVNFLIMVSIPISVALFAWAGILYFTSAANPKGVARAKKIFSAVFIGFGIALSGWLVVQVILQSITNSNFFVGSSWTNIQCVDPSHSITSPGKDLRPRDKKINSILEPVQSVGAPPATTGNTGGATSVGPQASSASGGGNGTNVPTVITNSDGTQTTMDGGSIAWRNNNPGNMISGITGYPSIGSNAGFAVFPDYQTGFDAMVANLQTRQYQATTVAGALQLWAPGGGVGNDPGGINNPAAYAAFVQRETGISANTPMSSLDRAQLVQVGNAIQKMEGYNPGKVITR